MPGTPATFKWLFCRAVLFVVRRWVDDIGTTILIGEFKNFTAVDFAKTPQFVEELQQFPAESRDKMVMKQGSTGLKKVQ